MAICWSKNLKDYKASLLPSGVAIGDVLKVEADFMIDGIEITAVLPQKIKKDGPELLELLGTGKETAGVTTSLVKRAVTENGKMQELGQEINKLRIENSQGVQKHRKKRSEAIS